MTNYSIYTGKGSLRFGDNSADTKLGIFGATPVVRQAALTTQKTTVTYTAPAVEDFAFDNMTKTTPYGFANHNEASTLLVVVKNLQDRVAELEARLQAYGLLP